MLRSSNRIRVLQVIGALHYGGAEKVIAHLATGIDSDRFEVSVCCTRGIGALGEKLRDEGVPVILSQQYTASRRYLAPYHLHRVIKRVAPHVVHTHGEVGLAVTAPLKYLGLLPTWVHTFHYGNYPHRNRKWMWMERILCKGATELVAVADAQREAIIRYHRVRPDSIRTLMNGVLPNHAVEHPDTATQKRQELGLTADDIVVGAIAVLTEQKGITYMLKAAQLALAKHPRLKFVIVGGGPLLAGLKAEAEQLGIKGSVIFTDWRTDVQEMLAAMDIFVMSSLWEAMPLTLLEAMAARRAIVVTNVGDNARFVDGGGCAIVVPPKDPAAIADGIDALVTAPDRARELARKASERYHSHYTVGHMVRAHEALYERLRADVRAG
jgi:glycosyltransferase involved in cell wall biosynthesis